MNEEVDEMNRTSGFVDVSPPRRFIAREEDAI